MATRATVFGLDVRANRSLSFLQAAAAKPTARGLDISLIDDAGSLPWPKRSDLICDQRRPDGSVGFQIEAGGEAGYRISGPRFGVSILSADGRLVRAATGSGGLEAWQRLLVAQVLPFASVLQGLEVLHASATVVDGRAVAFVGDSGSGKTSLALALCGRGAEMLADDVLALELRDGELLGHPGAPIAAIAVSSGEQPGDPVEGEQLSADARERVSRVSTAVEPMPVGALFLLDRRADGPKSPRIEAVSGPPDLLAATFNFVLAAPQRLAGLLDVCATVAGGQVERILTGPETDISELSALVERRLAPT